MTTMSFPDFGRVSNINLDFPSTHIVSRNLIKNIRGDRESRYVPPHYEVSFLFSLSYVVVSKFSIVLDCNLSHLS